MSLYDLTKTLPDGTPDRDAGFLPALNLAYIGDTVYDLYVRNRLIACTDGNAHRLHLAASELVCAAGQARAFRKIEPMLTKTELNMFHRGRNAHNASVPKNASVTDYRTATGLETLFGYLYWTGQDARMKQLMTVILEEEAVPNASGHDPADH